MNQSTKIKIALFHYLRFHRNYKIIASEVQTAWGSIGDVVASDTTSILEVEIKCTKADFIKDFDKKINLSYRNTMNKHDLLVEGKDTLPNLFYFCVPVNIHFFVEEYLKDKPYGLFVYTDRNFGWDPGDSIGVVRRGKKLHEDYSKKLEYTIITRSTSELARLYKKYSVLLNQTEKLSPLDNR